MTGISEWKPITMSLRNSDTRGTANDQRFRSNDEPEKSATAPMGVRFHGCGITRMAVAIATRAVARRRRASVCCFMLSSSPHRVTNAGDESPPRRRITEYLFVSLVRRILDFHEGRESGHPVLERDVGRGVRPIRNEAERIQVGDVAAFPGVGDDELTGNSALIVCKRE